MSLDADTSKLRQHGTVTVAADKIIVSDFEGDNCSCRDVGVQACIWAIGELQREVLRTLEAPGAGNIAIGD